MSPAPVAAAETALAREAPRRRRRLGLQLLGVGVALLGLQGLVEWQLPYDVVALEHVRTALGLHRLSPQALLLGWAGACLSGLLALGWAGSRDRVPMSLSLAVGLLLGSARLAAGGSEPALLLLLLVGVSTLGWQSARDGGLGMLLATVLGIVGWDLMLSGYPTLWLSCAMVTAMFVWIERRHIQATERQLLDALTQREALIGVLDRKQRHLELLQEARTTLLAAISHDLRQPLQAIRLYGEALLARVEGSPPMQRDVLQRQLQAADDATAMLDQFGEFSAIEQGALGSRPEVLDLRELLDRVAQALHGVAAGGGVRVRVRGRPAWVRVDRAQMQRIVQNLAGNAVRYSRREDGGGRVLLAVRRLAGGCVVDVVDNGPGIPEDRLDLVFEPYVQLGNAPGSRGGRGLGLAIVRGLVQQQGLQLPRPASVPGRGSRFRIGVPAAMCVHAPEGRLAADATGAIGSAAASGAGQGTGAGTGSAMPASTHAAADAAADAVARQFGGRLIAVLDDDSAARDALAAALTQAGASVVSAGDLATLERRLDDEVRFPDALVFDLDLGDPAVDGAGAIRHLRAAWELEVPAVIVTGRRVDRAALDLPAGCALLAKPVALARLAAALAR